MAFPGLKYASSGILAALRAGTRLTRRPGRRRDNPTGPGVALERADAAAGAPPIASLAPLTAVISGYLKPEEVERVVVTSGNALSNRAKCVVADVTVACAAAVFHAAGTPCPACT